MIPSREYIYGVMMARSAEIRREAEARRCDCDLRDARWDPYTEKCRRCGGLSWREWDRLQREVPT